ncbi:MAG: hypothetical protein K6F39_05605 [Lachnospiraceae bacterium]|nr:hypothetical protein [Lachnospiraceae bacterium]
MADLKNELPRLLFDLDVKAGLKNFKKNRYEDFFKAYRDDLSSVYELINETYEMPDKEEKINEAALSLVNKAKNKHENAGFFKKQQTLLDMQCMMVFYVLPGILANGKEDDRMLTDSIVGQWRAAFPDSKIDAASYDELFAGFRNTIFGFSVEDIFSKNK